MRRIFPAIAAGATALAVAGGTFGYATLDKAVTLSIDGQVQRVQTMAPTVGDLLENEDIEVGDRDVIAPSLDAKLAEGAIVAVRYGREVTFDIDGRGAGDLDHGDHGGPGGRGVDHRHHRGRHVSRPRHADRAGGSGRRDRHRQDRHHRCRGQEAQGDDHGADGGGGAHGGQDRGRRQRQAERQAGRPAGRRGLLPLHPGHRERADQEGHGGPQDRTQRDRQAGPRRHEGGHRGPLRRAHAHLPGGAAQRQDGQQDRDRLQDHQEAGDRGRAGRHQGGEPTPTSSGTEPSGGSPASGSVWDRLAQCESGGNWSINTGNGYYGGLQFSLGTWRAYGGSGMPHQNSRAQQIAVAQRLQSAAGWGQWPACSRKLGLR